VVIEPFRSWPVGSVFVSISPDNPAVALGGGTWERFAKGRTLVSLDEAQTEFDTVLETGGEKTHLLTPAELPRHSHGYTKPGFNAGQFVNTGSETSFAAFTEIANTIENPTDAPDDPNDQPHNNLQPYINVYMWLRTA
jgi:microcystin-dependent protein